MDCEVGSGFRAEFLERKLLKVGRRSQVVLDVYIME